MKIRAEDFEDPLPENLDSLRIKNDYLFHSRPRSREALPDYEKLAQLIDGGYGGIVRDITQRWLQKNEASVEILELLVRSDDSMVPRYQYVEWCNELLGIDEENEVALEFLLYYRERKNVESDGDIIANRLAKVHPNNSTGRKYRIQDLIERGDYESGFELCQKVLEEDSENVFALRNRAIICTLMGKLDDSAYFWSEWLDSGEAPEKDWFRAARAHYNCRHYSETISIIEEIISNYPEKEKILDLYIRANYSLFEWGRCLELCEEVLEINSRNSSGLKYSRLTKARLGPRIAVIPVSADFIAEDHLESGVVFWHEYL
jgi:tetratricopeptide (TPR) repeat protein